MKRKWPQQRTCPLCGENFAARNSAPLQKYCSCMCANRATAAKRAAAIRGPRPSQRRRRTVTCVSCGAEFERTVGDVARGRAKYCSVECFRAAVKPDGGNELHAKTKTQDLRKVFSLALKGEKRCRNCRWPAHHLHHAIPRSMSRSARTELLNGLPLCATCHQGWHFRNVVIYRDVFRPEEWAYLLSVEDTGRNIESWLDRRYPARGALLEDVAA
jgi:hypothetical protein